ncbi:mitogen-activated protein kinase 15 [Rhincodon typus]|uniref:mitogen-activated protein kinase 15 n=1 Tax=Rhincodon typus TaxID=259920 RepID=UPI0020306E27|nr:mitogen-activated protein kinase 15 [Rhincodon typus]
MSQAERSSTEPAAGKLGQDSEEEEEEEAEILEESPCGRWQKRPEQVRQGNAASIEKTFLAMDTEEGVEVAWNEVHFANHRVFHLHEENIKLVFEHFMQLEHPNIVKFHKYWIDNSENPDRKRPAGESHTRAYGIVWKAIDRQTGEVVAVKKIFDAFRNQTDAQRTFREILFLQEFGNHPNIIKLLNVIRAANDKDIYLVFEYMETDLHAVIKKGNLLKDIHVRYILYQLLKATKFIHSGNVIHRDQKPSNILLDADCFVKLCDFGLARCINQIQEEQGNAALTEYVATRWYRAPEILLASPRYTKGVDMWSIGCILGEMLLGKPLFPGTSSINQIERIMSVIPAPSKEDILSINSDYGASVVQKVLSRPRSSIDLLLPSTTPPDALDLLNKLLVFNPDCRLTAEESLSHPYVNRFHNPLKEPGLDCDIVLPVNDDTQLSVGEYRNKLYEMILERKINVRLQKRFLKGLEPVKPSPDPDQKELMPAGPKTIGVSTTEGSIQPVLHGDRALNNPIVNRSSYNPITHNAISYASSHSEYQVAMLDPSNSIYSKAL